jgi:hypothetical protein
MSIKRFNLIKKGQTIFKRSGNNQAYYGDHWLFTNIEKKATLDIEIFQ